MAWPTSESSRGQCAGAIVSAYGESAIEKVELLKECGITISKNPSVMGETVKKVLVENNLN